MSQQFPPEISASIRKGDRGGTRAFESVYLALYEPLYQYAYSGMTTGEASLPKLTESQIVEGMRTGNRAVYGHSKALMIP